jgi:hypothetical protein
MSKGRELHNCRYIPNDGRLNNVFTILVNCFQDIGRLGLDFGLDRQVQIDTDLL